MSMDTRREGNGGQEPGEVISNEEKQLLFKVASKVPEEEAIIVFSKREGDITILLAEGAAAGNGNQIYNIKPRLLMTDDKAADIEDTDTRFISRLEEAGVRNLVDISCIDSVDTRKKWRKSTGLLVMHLPTEYPDIKPLFRDWERHLSKNARVVIGNSDRTGPARVLSECLGNIGDFEFEERAGHLTVIRIDECPHHWIINGNEVGICKLCRRERNFKKLMKETESVGLRRRAASRPSGKKQTSSARKN